MNNFSRTELKLILEGLDTVRERMRDEAELDPEGLGGDEYNELVRLQDRIVDALESRFY